MLLSTIALGLLSLTAAAPAPAQTYTRDCAKNEPQNVFSNATHWWVPESYYFGANTQGPKTDNTCGIWFVPVKITSGVYKGWTVARTFYPDGRLYKQALSG